MSHVCLFIYLFFRYIYTYISRVKSQPYIYTQSNNSIFQIDAWISGSWLHSVTLYDCVPLSYEGRSFKAKGHNDVVFNSPLLLLLLCSPHPGPVPSESPPPHRHHNTTDTTPTWASARLWMNEELQTSLLSSFDVEHWGLSVWRMAASALPLKHWGQRKGKVGLISLSLHQENPATL